MRSMAKKRILVSDPISDKGVELLSNHPDLEVDVNTGLSPEELIKIIPAYHGLIIRSQTKVTADVLEGADDRDRSPCPGHRVRPPARA